MNIKPAVLRLLTASGAVVLSSQTFALEPASINLGPLDFTPVLQVTTGHDDNIRANNQNDSSWVTSIQPTFTLGAAGLKSEYQVSYSFAHDYFHSFSSEKTTDHFLDAAAFFEFDSRNRLLLGVDFTDTTEFNDANTPNDEFRTRGFNALYSYGVQSARFNLDLGFDTNRTRTQNSINSDKDLNASLISSTLYYRVSPRTRLLAEVRHSKQDYTVNDALDSTNRNYLLGAQWEATAFTTGSIRIGRGEKDFKDATKDDVSRNMWELGLAWEPLTYSRFNVTTRSSIEEGDEGADSIKQQLYRVGWNHDWNGFISTTAAYSFLDKDYDNGRNDKNHLTSIGLNYAVDRWVDIGLRYEYTDNNSSVATENYTRNQILLTLTVSL